MVTCFVPIIIVSREGLDPVITGVHGKGELQCGLGHREQVIPSEVCVGVGVRRGSYWTSELHSPWHSRKGREMDSGLLFGIDDLYEFRLEGCTPHEEAVHIRLARQLLAVCRGHRTWERRRGGEWSGMGWAQSSSQPTPPQAGANPLTPINDAGALSHFIRDIGLQPFPELFVYFLGLEQEARRS